MDMSIEITKSNEDYLEAILRFENEGQTKSVDVANSVGVTKTAVNIAVKELEQKGLATKESYKGIVLTDKGREIATKVYGTHTLLRTLYKQLGISDEVAELECCQIEHILSEETLACIKKFVK